MFVMVFLQFSHRIWGNKPEIYLKNLSYPRKSIKHNFPQNSTWNFANFLELRILQSFSKSINFWNQEIAEISCGILLVFYRILVESLSFLTNFPVNSNHYSQFPCGNCRKTTRNILLGKVKENLGYKNPKKK